MGVPVTTCNKLLQFVTNPVTPFVTLQISKDE